MFNNLFINDNYRPEGAYEIEKRVRTREEQLVLCGYQENAEESAGSKLILIPFKELFVNPFTSSKVPRRQYAADSRE
jgi:hypothetical protein